MSQVILRLPKVMARVGLSRSSIYVRVRQGTFPKPVPLGARAVGWPDSDIDSLTAAYIAGKTDDEIRQLVTKLEAARQAKV
jgi:prophage regulatory protein